MEENPFQTSQYYGSSGKAFVDELAKNIQEYVDSAGESQTALYKAFVMPVLLLQRTSTSSRAKQNIENLNRRLDLWKRNDFHSLLEEGRVLQRPGRKSARQKQGSQDQARHFSDLMSSGKVHEALEMLRSDGADQGSNAHGSLRIDDTVILNDGQRASVKDLLLEKHPAAQTPPPEILLDGEASPVHPVRYDSLSASLLKSIALHSHGSAGPSGLNSTCWRRMFSFKKASANLCHAIAGLAQLLASKVVNPVGVSPLLSSRLFALDKQPGVRPIRVGRYSGVSLGRRFWS